MNRRQFLKALGISLLATQIPIGVADAYPNFDPTHQYGDYCTVTDFIDKEVLTEYHTLLMEQVKLSIPPRYRGNIEWAVVQPPSDGSMCNRGTIGWKYIPNKS